MPLLEEDVEETPTKMEAAQMIADVALVDDEPAPPELAPVVAAVPPVAADPVAVGPPVADVAPPVVAGVPPVAAADPVTITAGHQTFPVDGATRTATGEVVFEKASWERAQGVFSRGIDAEMTFRNAQRMVETSKREVADAKMIGEENDARTIALASGLTDLMKNIMADPDIQARYGGALASAVEQITLRGENAALMKRAELTALRSQPDQATVTQQRKQQLFDILNTEGRKHYPGLFETQATARGIIVKYLDLADQFVDTPNGPSPDAYRRLDIALKHDSDFAATFRTEHQSKAAAAANVTTAAKANAAVTAVAPAPTKSVAHQPRAKDGTFTATDDEDEDAQYRSRRRQARADIAAQVAAVAD